MTSQDSPNHESTKSTCACIIAFYNEGERVINVLTIITKVKNLSTIICVDDGSHDEIYKKISALYPQIKVVRLEKNSGKSAAVAEGLKHCADKYVLLFDADLYGFQKEEIEKPIDAILHDPKVDMIILRRASDPWFSKIVRGDITVTGERILRANDLREVFERKPNSYQLEFASNLYITEKKKKAYWIPYSGKNTPKIKKDGLIKGVLKEFRMYVHITSYGGFIKTVINMITFCTKEYKKT